MVRGLRLKSSRSQKTRTTVKRGAPSSSQHTHDSQAYGSNALEAKLARLSAEIGGEFLNHYIEIRALYTIDLLQCHIDPRVNNGRRSVGGEKGVFVPSSKFH